ncbi:MAG: prepilin-type N-terminal cleavage/methylation domain-containing protein, partial [bacterium]|nr:prepilin-type N-terminal cleavage/methylation domain-containing protein [bacterium]
MASKQPPQRAGFTLVEATLALALVAVVLVAGFDLLWQVLTEQVRSIAQREAQQNAQFMLRRMETELRGAAGVKVGESAFGVNPGVLSLDYPGAASDVVFDTATTTVSIGGSEVETRFLRATVGGGSPVALTGELVTVNSLVFTNLTRPGSPESV